VVDEGKKVLTAAKDLITNFEKEAKANTVGILQKSRELVLTEAHKYGITDTQLQMASLFGDSYLDDIKLEGTEVNTQMAAAAKELADLRSKVANAVIDRNNLKKTPIGADTPLPPAPDSPDGQKYAQLADQINEDRRQLALLRPK
jgi:hypothetical protein